MKNELQWYIAYTKPRWEKKVSDLLNKKKIENYCPLNMVQKQWNDRRKEVTQPLFESFVFVRLSENEFTVVQKTDGVMSLVYWLGNPAIISDSEIETIKTFLSNYKYLRLEKTGVNLSGVVKALKESSAFGEKNVTELIDNYENAFLPSLGYVLIACIPKIENVKVLSRGKNVTQSKISGVRF